MELGQAPWKKAGYVILRFLNWFKKARARSANLMILMGVLILSLSVDNAWWQYRLQHSILDMVDTSPQKLVPIKAPIGTPTFRPTRTPFQPATLTPFQPENDQEGPIMPEIPALPDSTPLPTSSMIGLAPDRLVIPAIHLDAPVVPIHYKTIEYEGQTFVQWLVPNTFAAGWHDTSALLGLPGNTVLNGHHNAYGQVFKDLVNLELGDSLEVYSGEHVFTYHVVAKMLFPERYRPIEERIANARWILPSDDERLTLNTCWPPDGNTDRVVIVAFPNYK
jgi:sortase A